MSQLILPKSMEASYNSFGFAPAQLVDGNLHCSGQIGTLSDGKVPDSPEDEFRRAWQLVGEILKEAQLDYSNIFEFTSYHVNLRKHLGAFLVVKEEFIFKPFPAWTAIGVTELAVPNARVEIRVHAR